jgi:phage terminase large subunit-like protein
MEEDLFEVPVYVGLDIASKSDLTSLCLVGEKEGQLWTHNYYWIPSDNVAKIVRDEKIPFDFWIEQGFLEETPGNVLDTRYLTERIISILKRYKMIKHVCYDPAFSYDIFPSLQDEGYEISEFKQTLTNYTIPCIEFEKLYMSGKLKTNKNPVTDWCASNVSIYRSYDGRMKPEKDYKSSKNRIDGISSMLFALQAKFVSGKSEDGDDWQLSEVPKDLRKVWGL